MANRYLMVLLTVCISALLILVSGCQGSSSDQAASNETASLAQNDQSASEAESSSDNSDPEGNARIFFPEIEYDFGTAGRNATLTHVFKVQNKGDAPLKLIKAKGS
ncbi:MAG: hypothetical protein ABIK83_09625 [Candidatus Zixiibacteriota bacterium]